VPIAPLENQDRLADQLIGARGKPGTGRQKRRHSFPGVLLLEVYTADSVANEVMCDHKDVIETSARQHGQHRPDLRALLGQGTARPDRAGRSPGGAMAGEGEMGHAPRWHRWSGSRTTRKRDEGEAAILPGMHGELEVAEGLRVQSAALPRLWPNWRSP